MAERTDSLISPVSNEQADVAIVAQLLDQILSKAHPLLAEGLYLAAVSPWYDAALFKAMRGRDDGRDERLVARLARFSFVRPLDEAAEGEAEPRYAVQATERDILLRRWMAAEPEAFVAAHRRALAFWEAHAEADAFERDQARVYHSLVADGEAGLEHLAEAFRAYTGERRLAAADRLLVAADEVRGYLAILGASWLAALGDLLAYLRARLAQFRGRWHHSLSSLEQLRHKADLAPRLMPHVVRAYGSALARAGQYVEAIEQYQIALDAFGRRPEGRAEQARTMLNLGDAHVGLAVSARGYREVIPPQAGRRTQRWLGGLLSFRGLLPLIAYMSWHFGSRMWLPTSWAMLQELDWIIARLFVTGARWYRQARQLFDAQDARADLLRADERLAHLYLTMGDAAQAVPLFRALLNAQDTSVGEYRQASIEAGLGRALLRLGKAAAAQEHLQKALPVLRAYDDTELDAQVRGLLAEALVETGKHSQALRQFQQALRLYQGQGDVVGATEIAERLRELAADRHLTVENRETASTTTQNLTRHQYLERFQHPALVVFRRASLVLLAILIFFTPMLAIHVETESVIDADVRFYPSALTAPNPDYSPTLSQAVALDVEPSFEAEFALQQALALLALYLLAYTVLGVVVISQTRLRTVQEAQDETVRFDLQGLAVGQGQSERFVRWQDIQRISIADIEFLSGPMTDNSATVVAAPQEELTIRGSTAWYAALQDHIRAFAAQAPVVRLGYAVLQSRMGLWYGLSVLGLVVFLVLRAWAPDALLADLVGPYSLADLYPYLYIGLLVPHFWWLVVRPLGIQTQLNPRSPLAWWVGAAGLVLAGLRFLFPGTWLILPDVYPSLCVILLLGSAGVAVWRARRPGQEKQTRAPHVYALWVRGLAAVVVVALLVLAGFQLGREVQAYHFLIAGNSQRDAGLRAERQGEHAVAQWYQDKALASYTRALALSPQNITALSSRAAIQAQLGRFGEAIADYSAALQLPGANDADYAYRAMAYESWGLALLDSDEAQAKLAAALADLDRAIAFYPENEEYYVRRGAIHHLLKQFDAAQAEYQHALELDPQNGRGLLAQGWILFQQATAVDDAADQEGDKAKREALEAQAEDTFRLALASFKEAASHEPDLPEIWLAVGYGHFALREYEATIAAWERAIALAPDDPVMIISRGMGHWILAGTGGCTRETATEAEKQEVVTQLNLTIDDLNRALALRPTDDWTYRTRAQIEYLLAFCPGYDTRHMLSTAIASYDTALQYDPHNDLYWLFRGRLKHSLGQHIFVNEPGKEDEAQAALQAAIEDVERAYTLGPENGANELWRDFLTQVAWGRFFFLRGLERYAAGGYGPAQADFEDAARLLEPHPVFLEPTNAAFNAGLAALAQCKSIRATEWYGEGLKRAAAIEHPQARLDALQASIDGLQALLARHPWLTWLAEPIVQQLQAAADAVTFE